MRARRGHSLFSVLASLRLFVIHFRCVEFATPHTNALRSDRSARAAMRRAIERTTRSSFIAREFASSVSARAFLCVEEDYVARRASSSISTTATSSSGQTLRARGRAWGTIYPAFVRGRIDDRVVGIDIGRRSFASLSSEERKGTTTDSSSRRDMIRLERNFNVPNALCVGRILAGPALAYGTLTSAISPELALAGAATAAATDFLDGYLARRWNQGTILGSYLDPIADKVFVGFVGTALAIKGALPVWLVALLVSRDVIHVMGGAWRRAGALHWEWRSMGEFFGIDDDARDKPKPTGAAALAGFDFDLDEIEQLGSRRGALRPLFIGKVNTALQMVLITAVLCEPVAAAGTAPGLTQPILEIVADDGVKTTLEYATAASAVVATAEYARIFFSHPGFERLQDIQARGKDVER